MSRCLRSIAAALVVFTAHSVDAQTAVLSGTVVRDSSGTALADAEVSLPDLRRSTKTNYRGEFKFERLPAGVVSVVIRRVGFALRNDTVTLADGARIDREFILEAAATQLDSVVTTAAAERKYISPALNEFEERRRQGFGYFITDDVLRKEEQRDMLNIITGHVPGLTRIRVPPNINYLGSARKCAPGPAFINCTGKSYCPVTLYVDGVRIFDAMNQQAPSDIPNLSNFRPNEYAAVEFYAGSATTPPRFNTTNSGCGILLLWTRER